ncbi:aminomethyl transferase family protein [Pseudolysinimonas yzui]|uniref:Glycine cleavage system protein T n=1 Tax=Pseudolysinimonas yzui TaxID=2708254 RepID=A0A8J3M310_9MICO|nr:aminomethyl transferase family protein [Pseudolysinimonas yzui]GHF23516.1 glycine cleavage system protein T [Pseudolysinimonas yzui]
MNGFISLQDRLDQVGGNAATLLRTNPYQSYPFPYPPDWATWHAEQWGWANTCTLFDQSHHMSDIYFTGPDALRLFSATGVNGFTGFREGRAKQFVGVNGAGQFIGDAILFGLEKERYSLVGAPIIANWVEWHAKAGGYDVEVEHDDASEFNRTGGRKLWRFQLNGPLTQDVVEKAAGAPLGDVPFFGMTDFEIAGTPVRALNHTMAGVPGLRHTGLELFGPVEHSRRVLDALVAAGEEFGLVRGGSMAYTSAEHESGWIAAPIPAIYDRPEERAYRESLFGFAAEGTLPLTGSFDSDDITDYYTYPEEIGYGHLVKFDHDFIGREALEARVGTPSRRKVWLEWNADDFMRVMRDALFGEGDRPRIVSIPNLFHISQHYDAVRAGDEVVGFSGYGGYTVNLGRVVSHGVIAEAHAVDGHELVLEWGEPHGGKERRFMEPHHVSTTVRVTVHTTSPALKR